MRIEHNYTSFYERIKYLILLWIGATFLCFIFSMFFSKDNTGTFIIIMSLILGLLALIKIYRNYFYIFSFYCDSKNVKVGYLKGSQKCLIETQLENIDVKFRNTSTRSGFNCELIFNVENIEFIITKDFDWNFGEMKLLFEYVKSHKGQKITDKEKIIIEQIKDYY